MTDNPKLRLNEKQTLEYLDSAIRSWRARRDSASAQDAKDKASCYVDAFQSVRSSLFGSTLA